MSLSLDPLDFEVLSPEETQAIWAEVEQECADFWEAGLLGLLEYGFMVFDMAQPGQMLDTFIKWTYPDDLPLVRNPDYLELRAAGAAPDLRANVEWQALLQPSVDPETGEQRPGGNPSDFAPFFWAVWLLMPPGFKWLQKKFISLSNAALKKQGMVAA